MLNLFLAYPLEHVWAALLEIESVIFSLRQGPF